MAGIAAIQFVSPPFQKFERFGGVSDFVAKVIGPTTIRVDIMKVLMQFLWQQPRDDREVFVVGCRQFSTIHFGRALIERNRVRDGLRAISFQIM